MAQIRPRFPDFARFSTSNLGSYNLRPQRELEAHIRWLCSPGSLFKILGSDFWFFDFFAENFSIFENPTSEKPKIPSYNRVSHSNENPEISPKMQLQVFQSPEQPRSPLYKTFAKLGVSTGPLREKKWYFAPPPFRRLEIAFAEPEWSYKPHKSKV